MACGSKGSLARPSPSKTSPPKSPTSSGCERLPVIIIENSVENNSAPPLHRRMPLQVTVAILCSALLLANCCMTLRNYTLLYLPHLLFNVITKCLPVKPNIKQLTADIQQVEAQNKRRVPSLRLFVRMNPDVTTCWREASCCSHCSHALQIFLKPWTSTEAENGRVCFVCHLIISRKQFFDMFNCVELLWKESSDLNDLIRKLSLTERHTAISALTEVQISNDLTVHLILNQCHCQKAIYARWHGTAGFWLTK